MSDPSGFGTVALLLERVLVEIQGLRADFARQVQAPAVEKAELEGVLDVKGAAALCRVSATTIYRASERGELRRLTAGARVRCARGDLDAWLRGERPDPARVLTFTKLGA